MPISIKNILYHAVIALVILSIGFALSSGIFRDISKKFLDKVMYDINVNFYHHATGLSVDAKHYFLLPEGRYLKEVYIESLSPETLSTIFFNTVFNMLFQPVFLCPFTPRVILNLALFPFFLYAAFKYFKKVWIMLAIFAIISFKIGIYDATVEALIRHGMSCELIYILIGLAGFTDWITKSS